MRTDNQATPPKHGSISDSAIQIDVEFDYPREAVWNFVTTPETLVTFYGTFTGEPDSGKVTLIMVEAPDSPGEVLINECRPPERLDLTMTDPNGALWSLKLNFRALDGERAKVEFIQDITGFEDMAPIVATGWEFYLARWRVAMAGGELEDITWADYAPLEQEYAEGWTRT